MAVHDQQLDKLLLAIGPRGRFVTLQLLILWIGVLAVPMQLLSNVFIGYPGPHRCARPINESVFIDAYRDVTGAFNVTVTYERCEIHVLSGDTAIKNERCLFGMEYDLPVDSSFVSQFDLVCESANLARLTQALVIGGQAVGALVAAYLSDRLGRKPVVVTAQLGMMFCGIGIAYSTNILMFSVFKFLVGGFQQASLSVRNSMMVELMRIKDRRIVISLAGSVWALGVMALGLLAYLVRDSSWRTTQLVFSLLCIPVIFELVFMREPLRWLLANGKTKRATDLIKSAARMNGKSQKEIVEALQLMVAVQKVVPIENEEAASNQELMTTSKDNHHGQVAAFQKMTYLDIFSHSRLVVNTLILWVGWFTMAFGFFAIYLGSTSLSGDRFLNFFLIALMEMPANVYAYFCLNRYGRKQVVTVMFLLMGAGLILSGVFRSLEATSVNAGLSLAFNMLAMVGASGGFGMLFFYTPELFPTNVRNQALGLSSVMARIGGMLAPFTAVLSDLAPWGPGLLIGCLAFLVAVLVRFLPETNGRELPQTLDDLLSWFTNKDTQGDNQALNDLHKNGTKKDNVRNEWTSVKLSVGEMRTPRDERFVCLGAFANQASMNVLTG